MSSFLHRMRQYQLQPGVDRKVITTALVQARYRRYEVTGEREGKEHTLVVWAHNFAEIEVWALGQLENVTAQVLGYAEVTDDDVILHD